MKTKLYLLAVWLMPFGMLLGCTHAQPIIQTKTEQVKVAVHSGCVKGEKPAEPVALRDRISHAEWDALTTDQRENLSQAQALDRKSYGDKLTGATAGCD